MSEYLRCYAEVSLENIRHNLMEVKSRIPKGVRLLVVIKANAYGHGAFEVAAGLKDVADFFAVATAEEAEDLVERGITTPVLILGYTSPSQAERLIGDEVRMTVYDPETARQISERAAARHQKAMVHIAVDTGMTRIGFHPDEAGADAIEEIAALPNLEVEGMFTHLSCADQFDQGYTMEQLRRFDAISAMLKQRGVSIPIRHCCNSAAVMELDDHRYDMVRSGIVTYGIYPSEEVHKERMHLLPALSWRAHVIHLQEVPKGTGVSYGATFVTTRPMTRIATISVGYADGYPRALSSKGCVLIRGKRAPILGRVCMDQMMVDVTDIDGVSVEDVATLIGTDGEETITLEEVADPACSFNYELLCRIAPRVPRIYI